MKRVVIGISLLLIVAATASLIPSRAQEASAASANAAEQAVKNEAQAPTKNWPDGNPLKIAQLKWYQANLTTSFNVGKTQNSNPYGLAFDGQNIWSANFGEGTVTCGPATARSWATFPPGTDRLALLSMGPACG